MASDDTSKSKELEWEERTLCSDEACIGIIGPDGRCKECGKPYAGKPAGADDENESLDDLSLAPDPLLDSNDEDGDGLDDDLDDIDTDDEEDAHWEDRILCRDESCIGVIGPDGRCKECGLPLDEEDA